MYTYIDAAYIRFNFVWFPHAINFAIRCPIILDSHVFFHRLLSSILTTTVVFRIDFLISTVKIVKSTMHYFSATTFHFQWLIIPSSVQDEEPSMADPCQILVSSHEKPATAASSNLLTPLILILSTQMQILITHLPHPYICTFAHT